MATASHRLFQVLFIGSSPVVFCRRCGVYTAKRANSGIKGYCAGIPSTSGKVVLDRLDRGLHPSREAVYKGCTMNGRPQPLGGALALGSHDPHGSGSTKVKPLEILQPLLERVRARANTS